MSGSPTKKIAVIFSILLLSGMVFLRTANAGTLSCSVTTAAACTGTVIWRMSGATNAHAELPSQATAAYNSNVVCCSGVTGLGNACTSTFATALKLSGVTNAHVQQTGSYTQSACISVPSGGSVSIGYQATNCTGFDTTLGSMSGTTNAHVGDGTAYTTKICGTAAGAASLTFTIDANTKSLGTLSPGTLVSGISTLTVDTANSTGFNITVSRDGADTAMDLDTDAATNIADKTAWSPGANCTTAGNATASTTEPQTLQFRVRLAGTASGNYCSSWWGTDDTTANARFAGFPSTGQKIVDRSTASSPSTDSLVLYNLDVPATQKNGAYSGSITYTAVANP
jgi:hypothetical protein